MTKFSLLALAFGSVVTVGAMAAPPGGVTFSPNGRTVIVPRLAGAPVMSAHRAAGMPVFDNLATLDPEGVYTVGSGAGFGDVTPGSHPIELAAAFTPSTNVTVTEIDVGAGYISGAKNLIQVRLYQDAGGVPGATLWGHPTTLPVDGTCCAIAALTLHTKTVTLVAGQQYWIGLDVAKDAHDTFAAWYGNVADQVDSGLTAINQGSGWTASPTVPLPAFAVYGE
jgi:hypothetical protein